MFLVHSRVCDPALEDRWRFFVAQLQASMQYDHWIGLAAADEADTNNLHVVLNAQGWCRWASSSPASIYG